MSEQHDKPTALAPPPVIYLPAVLAALLVNTIWPAGFVSGSVRYWGGGVLVGMSGAIMPFVIREFRRAKTSFDVRKQATAIITSGPFRLSRNPSYVSLTLLCIGLGMLLNNLWILILLLPAVLVVHFGVILREERHLEAKFGDAYRTYKMNVRRWL